jgi:2-dehydro-3-deoxy-D-arabinonate dehydratase
MYLTRHETETGARWALDRSGLPSAFSLGFLLQLPRSSVADFLASLPKQEPPAGRLLPPIEPTQEVWASGVTYMRSRDARTAESGVKDVYEKVYEAERPELFFKSTGLRAVGHGMKVRVRADATWNVPEPELTLVVNRGLEIVGYTAGNDMSSRDIEGENPLYLPQAKVFNGSCAVGPGIQIASAGELGDVAIAAEIERGGTVVFRGETRSSRMRRKLTDLAGYLGRELDFPEGALLMTGTGIVPPDDFSLVAGDVIRVRVGALTLENEVGGR